LLAIALTGLLACPFPALAAGKLKVFILAGQSNMEGKAKVSLLEHQCGAPETKEMFKHYRKDGKWVERDDVWIDYLGRRGKLTVGYGSKDRVGCELEFGHVMGNTFEEPVLLIKTAWGGKSIARDFRPPSSGLPSDEKLQELLNKENENIRKKNEKQKNPDRRRPETTMDDLKARYGHYYREMMKEIEASLGELSERFPEYKGQGYEICGFVWFQGWNDMCNAEYVPQYATHMANFIRDIRKDLDVPKLPFVIGIMGQNGEKPATGRMLEVQQAQASMEDVPEFKGNVKAVRTDVLVDKTAAAIYPEWRKRFEEWEKVGSDFGYHYMGSAVWFTRMGKAFAESTLDLM